ncbi:MAG: indole-3-glycerol phosphate synthase TrpC [Armatimonadetes bacterium]|nr:indole-3-glycerol phosphate synthase TrpC [Armatimonadota bacterium]
MILERIASAKRIEVEDCKRLKPLDGMSGPESACRDFEAAISGPRGAVPRIIAEVKKASPSKGIIREDFDPVAIARAYESAGSAAVSVLTDEKFFQGRLEYLTQCRSAVRLPALRKDFIIDSYQIHEARAAGADAILLIAALLDTETIRSFIAQADKLQMASLVEVHDERELDSALEAGARIIGINNRNLRTFEVDIENTFRLVKRIPEEKIVVSESGIATHEDVRRLLDAGVHAALIGEMLMRASDPGAKLRELLTGQ